MVIKNPLADLFGKSPIKPLQEHMKVAASAADQLTHFVECLFKRDFQGAEECYNQIRSIENKADDLKHGLRLQLPKTLFLPVPREDLLDLLTVQDKIANRAKDIAGLMLGRKMFVPEEIQEKFMALLKVAIESVHQAVKAIGELDELLESGFSGRELSLVEKLVEELNTLERQADELEIELRAALFEQESQLPPVEVMFLYRIIEALGDLADRAQKVGSRLLPMLAR